MAPGALRSREQAQDALRRAAAEFERVMRPHTLAAMLCQALYEQLRSAAERSGHPGLELSLVTGYGQMAETDVVTDLWAVSRDRLSLDEFVLRYGYHGPEEGELSSRIWRLDRSPLEGLLAAYREMGEDRDPRAIERSRGHERRRAEAELFGALPAPQRAAAQLVARLAARFIPLRGTGKAAFLQCVDVARAAAQAIGEEMTAAGQLDDPRDVFMFTVPELLGARAPLPAVAERRAIHDEYRRLEIPDLFNGVPVPFPGGATYTAPDAGAVITGTPVSSGVVEGVARLVLDQSHDDALQPGEGGPTSHRGDRRPRAGHTMRDRNPQRDSPDPHRRPATGRRRQGRGPRREHRRTRSADRTSRPTDEQSTEERARHGQQQTLGAKGTASEGPGGR